MDLVSPATINPPSLVCWMEFAKSSAVPPRHFCHSIAGAWAWDLLLTPLNNINAKSTVINVILLTWSL
ncbi:MAG: hypothetical protein ACOX2C_09200 [Bacteroidales bacterium]